MRNIYRLWFVLVLISGTIGEAFAQIQIKGKVLDSNTKEPIIAATVSVIEELSGSLTDVDGAFTVPVKELPAVIKISYLGYREQQVDVYDASEPILVELVENNNFLKEVVVVGYGTQKRKELTGSVASIGKE